MTDFKARYDRNYNTLTREDQAVLARSCVAVIGLGGLGGGVCEMLARTGVGHLTLVDGDRFDASNLNRQLLSREDLMGAFKADAARERIQAVNSSIRVTTHRAFGNADSFGRILKGACLVVDCLDSIDSRFVLQDAAQKADIPIVSGAIAGVTGQVMVIFPGDPGYEQVYGSRKTRPSQGIETETGNLSFCALFVASLQASECIKILIGKGEILRHKLLIADLWRNTIEQVDLG